VLEPDRWNGTPEAKEGKGLMVVFYGYLMESA
jgi:hypothetical protein